MYYLRRLSSVFKQLHHSMSLQGVPALLDTGPQVLESNSVSYFQSSTAKNVVQCFSSDSNRPSYEKGLESCIHRGSNLKVIEIL